MPKLWQNSGDNMRQMRIAGKRIGDSEWLDLVGPSMVRYAMECDERWRKEGLSYEDIRFEFRDKPKGPSLWSRVKDWWKW